MKRTFFVLTLLLCCALVVQAQEQCPTMVLEALDFTDDLCNAVERNQACYGNLAIEAIPQADATDFTFEAPGDIVDAADIQTLNLSAMTAPNEWGVALLSLQANLPDTLPGQNVTVLLFGEVILENAGAPLPPTLTITGGQTINIRSGPGTENRILAKFNSGDTATVDGRTEASDWLRIQLEDGGTGWVSADLVQIEGDTATLNVVEATSESGGITYGPLQAFYFASGVGGSDCAEAPQDGLLIQTPEGAGKINLLINEVSVELGSTAYLQAQPSGNLSLDLLEGGSTVTANDKTVSVLPGTRAIVPLDADGKAAGEPELTTIPDDALNGLQGMVSVLPRDIEIATPLTAAELEEATAVTLPNEGTWHYTDAGGGSHMGCVGMDLPPFEAINASLTYAGDGFRLGFPNPVTASPSGEGVYVAVESGQGYTTTFTFMPTSPDTMDVTAVTEISVEGLACEINWIIAAEHVGD
jgi:uncharacterized protein YgiM (DUF1202 family)